MAVMTANDMRHAVVLDECGPNFTYRPNGRLRGVISMQDVLRVMQIDDERLKRQAVEEVPPARGEADRADEGGDETQGEPAGVERGDGEEGRH